MPVQILWPQRGRLGELDLPVGAGNEHPVDYPAVEVDMRIQRAAEALHETHRPICPRAQPLASASCTCKRGTLCRYSRVGLVPNVLRSSLECGFEHRNWTAKPRRGTHIE